MFGSLLCFTSDGFRSVLFGKVVKRDLADLRDGQLIVGFTQDVLLPEDLMQLDFLMVESRVYFEPYYQVLTVLKTMDTQNFPMERYIVRAETDAAPPSYLTRRQVLHLGRVFNPEMQRVPVQYKIDDVTFSPLEWGDRRFRELNESQQAAFRAALTEEFCVVQGPPGTGKTFLGLKVSYLFIY